MAFPQNYCIGLSLFMLILGIVILAGLSKNQMAIGSGATLVAFGGAGLIVYLAVVFHRSDQKKQLLKQVANVGR
jgi:hypothetical protein